MAATIKDVVEDVLVQVIQAPRPVDADLLQRMARQLEGARRAILPLGGDGELGKITQVRDLAAEAGDLVDAVLKLGCDEGEDLGNEGVKAKLQAIADQLVATSNAGGVAKGPNVSESAAGPSSVSFCGSHLVRIAIVGFI